MDGSLTNSGSRNYWSRESTLAYYTMLALHVGCSFRCVLQAIKYKYQCEESKILTFSCYYNTQHARNYYVYIVYSRPVIV